MGLITNWHIQIIYILRFKFSMGRATISNFCKFIRPIESFERGKGFWKPCLYQVFAMAFVGNYSPISCVTVRSLCIWIVLCWKLFAYPMHSHALSMSLNWPLLEFIRLSRAFAMAPNRSLSDIFLSHVFSLMAPNWNFWIFSHPTSSLFPNLHVFIRHF